MSAETPEAPTSNPAAPACPLWCQARHTNPETEDHIRMVDAVHRNPRHESVAIELEQAAENPNPLVVLSLFTQTRKPKGMSAGLTIEQARYTHAALGEALRLLSDVAVV